MYSSCVQVCSDYVFYLCFGRPVTGHSTCVQVCSDYVFYLCFGRAVTGHSTCVLEMQ